MKSKSTIILIKLDHTDRWIHIASSRLINMRVLYVYVRHKDQSFSRSRAEAVGKCERYKGQGEGINTTR